MNKFFASLLGILLCSLISCQESNAEKGNLPEADPPAKTESSAEPAKKVVKVNWAKPDTSAPQPLQRPYSVATSRPSSEIKSVYPYDIDLKKADGTVVKSHDVLAQNGKPTILMFWLTTCVPCRIELGEIQKKFAQWQQEADFNLYAISTDFPKNYEQFVKRVNESQWPWQAFNDVNREFMNIMPGELNGLPQTFIIDADGNIVYHKRKYQYGDEDALFAKVLELKGQKRF